MSDSIQNEPALYSVAPALALQSEVLGPVAVAPSREYPYHIAPATWAQGFWWSICRRFRRIRYRWKCIDLRVGPSEYRKLFGWVLGVMLVVAPIAWGALLEVDKVKARPEMMLATWGWFVLILTHLVYSQVTAGSEFDRWSKRHSELVNEFGGGIERFSRAVRDAPASPELSGVVRRLVRQTKDAAAEWVSAPDGTKYRAYLALPMAADSSVVRIFAETSMEPAAQLPFGEIDAEREGDGLAFKTVHPRIIENTDDERHGTTFYRWTYASIVSFPIVVGDRRNLAWLGCLNIESDEPYVFHAAMVQKLLAPVLRPQIELLGLLLLYANQKSIVLR